MNEGFLGKKTFEGERAATEDHPAVLHALPLDTSVQSKLEVGTLLCAVSASETGMAWKPYVSTDSSASPSAVVDKPCDPTGDNGETSCIALVHGTVKTHLLKTGDNKIPTHKEIVKLMENGIFAI